MNSFAKTNLALRPLIADAVWKDYCVFLSRFNELDIYDDFGEDETARHVQENYGTVGLDTSVKKFGAGSAHSTDNGAKYIKVLNNTSDYNFGTGDFEIDFWMYLPTGYTYAPVLSKDTTASGMIIYTSGSSGLLYLCYTTTSAWGVYMTAAVGSLDAWHHYCISRASGVTRIFVDGVKITEASDTHDFSAVGIRLLQGYRSSIAYIQSSADVRLDELRILKGYAEHTSDFTPPTGQYIL